jgi:glycosyltransferase involved in cell wall biosynthesis
MPRVSVVMPAFNVAPYIGAAIDSVLAQTFDDFELIVVDDGATDESAAIAQEKAAGDPRIHVVRQKNRGLSAARNTALRLSAGDVIAILDSDDLWAPDYLEAQMAILDAHPEVDIVTSNAFLLGSRLHGQPARPCPDNRPLPDLTSILQDETAVFIMSVFRRRVYETIGGFDESMRSNEDYDYWLRAAAAGFRFARNDKPLGQYRRRDDSLSASELRMLHGILRVYAKLRPQIADRPDALAILDRQVVRFETERLAAEARAALEQRDYTTTSQALTALHTRRGGALLGVARMMARWTPGLLSKAYHLRRAKQEARA